MMNQGSYGYGGSSNLSALAPPFTVDRSVLKPPLVDLAEPATYHSSHNWVGPHHQPSSRPDYFSISKPDIDSNAFNNRYPSSTDSVLFGQSCSPTVVLDAKPYYPSYVSPAVGNDCPLDGVPLRYGYDLLSTSRVSTVGSSHEDYAQSVSGQWSGMWDGLTDWLHNEPVQLDGSFRAKENYMNQGLYASESMSKYEEASHTMDTVGRETQIESAGVGQLDYEPFLHENRKFIPADYPTPSTLASTLHAPETCPQVPSIKAVNSWNHQMPYGASYEQFLQSHGASSSDIATVGNCSPAVVIKPPAQDTNSFINVNTNSAGDITDFSCNNPSIEMEPHPFITSKDNVYYDASQVSFHLGKTDQVVTEFSSSRNEELPSNRSVSAGAFDHFAGRKPTIQVPCKSLNGLSSVDKNEATNHVKNYTECLDHCNPAVDSPCWRGASVSTFSQFDVSETTAPPNMKKLEAYSGSNHQSRQTLAVSSDDAVKISPERTSEKPFQHDCWSLENHLAPMKSPLVGNVIHREGIVNYGSNCTNPSVFHEVEFSDGVLSKKLFGNSDSEVPHSEQQSYEGGKWTAESNCAPVTGVAVAGMIMNDEPDDYSSHVPFHAIEQVLCSPPSLDDASVKLNKAHGEKSTQKMHVRTMIDTMQNLSELLVYHFSNDACELKQGDFEALVDVINNLESCVLKNVERRTSTEESTIPERATSQLFGKSSKLQKEYDITSAKNDEKLSKYISVKAAADVLKGDSVTQAIKKALMENFHGEEETEPQVLLYKNLWLEAEASLCYASCMARFDQMKNGMETNELQKAKAPGLPESSLVMEKLSKSSPCRTKTLACNSKDSPLPDASVPESSFLSTSIHPDDITARFHILKCRGSSSNAVNTSSVDKMLGSADKLSNCQVSLGPNNVEKVAYEEKVGQKPDKSIQDSLVSGTASHLGDVEASVMERFHILKCRGDNLTSMDREEPQTQKESVDFGYYAGLQRHTPSGTDGSEDKIVNMEPQPQHHDCNSTEDKLTVEEFHLFVKDDPVIESRMINEPGNHQCHGGLGDGSSDWEHVLLEELSGQNS